ncbi:MAG: flagellar assembly protein FliX [Beijerinckiaceae bacterium]
MRVTDKNPAGPVNGSAAPRQAAGAGARFSLGSTESAKSTASTQAAAPAGALDGLIALQAAGDSLERRKRAARRGRGLLDGLDDLKLALLSGRISESALANLSQQLRQKRETVDDPQLDELLAHIDLRAEVELAKIAKAKAAKQ